jgi:hypothetical protein
MTDKNSNSGGPLDPEDAGDNSVSQLWQSIIELGESLPPEEWDRVPTDLAANLHRYLYERSGEDD